MVGIGFFHLPSFAFRHANVNASPAALPEWGKRRLVHAMSGSPSFFRSSQRP
jgi:hypothetical protein